MTRRICFVGWAGHVHVERWAGWFAREGHAISVVSFAKAGRYPPGVRQLCVGERGRRFLHWRLRWLLWRLRPELVHVHWAHFAVPLRKAWRGPLVVTAWGSDVYRREAFSDHDWNNLGEALRRAELVTCDSRDMALRLEQEFGVMPQRIEVIQWGVDCELFAPSGPDLRETLGLVGREVVLSARNFTPLYNQDRVVAAFATVLEHRPRAFLLMKNYRGDPAVLEAVRADIARRGLAEHVRVLDEMPHEQMPALYRSADVTVSIPSSDATPVSVLEAMACGSPVIASDLASLREWVHEGETGYLVDPVDPAALAAKIESALDGGEPVRRIRTLARQVVVERASQAAHMATMSRWYDELVQARGRRQERLGLVRPCV